MTSTATELSDDEHQNEFEGLAVDLDVLMQLARPVRVPDELFRVPVEPVGEPGATVRLFGRRRALQLVGGAGALVVLAACGSTSSATDSTPTSDVAATGASTTSTTAAAGSVASSTVASTAANTVADTATSSSAATAGAEIPDETGGPFPGDGTNGPNALAEAGVVRQDIRSSFGSSTTTAGGIPVTFEFTVVDAATGAALPGASVYIWHCDRDGDYSMYSSGKTNENYLRGGQTADANGTLSFVSIYPGCYSGRWPHAHFEVYSSIDEATNGRQAMKTSQLAMPEETSNEAFAIAGYETSVRNFAGMSLGTDMVFSDGTESQVPTVTGNPTDGYAATLVVRV